MSEHLVIAGLSETLHTLFEAAITDDSGPGLNGMQIDLRSPHDMRLDNDALGLSVWLYRIDLAAAPRAMLPARATGSEPSSRSLSLEAHYLLTPIAEGPLAEQAMLGRVLEVLRDRPMLSGGDLRGALSGGQHEVRLAVETLTLAESTQLWEAMQEPYRAAVTCVARIVEAAVQ